jgi:hypothetical protein
MHPSIVCSVHSSSISSKKTSIHNDGNELPFKANALHSLLCCSTKLCGEIKMNEDLNFG